VGGTTLSEEITEAISVATTDDEPLLRGPFMKLFQLLGQKIYAFAAPSLHA
jgi:hypothetical protein